MTREVFQGPSPTRQYLMQDAAGTATTAGSPTGGAPSSAASATTQASRIQALGGAHNDLVAYFREHPNE
jgi:hypothetical protein